MPTFAESGLLGYTFASWFGILAPARAPPALIDQLNRELVRIINLPATRERFLGLGIEPLGAAPREYAQYLKNEIAQWSAVVRRHDIRAD